MGKILDVNNKEELNLFEGDIVPVRRKPSLERNGIIDPTLKYVIAMYNKIMKISFIQTLSIVFTMQRLKQLYLYFKIFPNIRQAKMLTT